MEDKEKKEDKKKSIEDISNDLSGFEIRINSFGEVESSMNVDDLNAFLNEHLEDKKLEDYQQKANDQQEEE